jgi:hypothetical protein
MYKNGSPKRALFTKNSIRFNNRAMSGKEKKYIVFEIEKVFKCNFTNKTPPIDIKTHTRNIFLKTE